MKSEAPHGWKGPKNEVFDVNKRKKKLFRLDHPFLTLTSLKSLILVKICGIQFFQVVERLVNSWRRKT
jgi:hypothetical protein